MDASPVARAALDIRAALDPAYLAADAIARGTLVRLLPDYDTEPTPLCLVYPQCRFMPHRNRAFRDFVHEWFADPARVRVFG